MQYAYLDRGSRTRVAVFNSRGAKSWEWFRTLRERRVSALHLKATDWYHCCINEVLELLNKHQPSVLIGSSMGGYAALLFSALTGIKAVAFNPQTALADWDKRWEEWPRIRATTKRPDLLELTQAKADIYYRDSGEDKQHAERMKANLFPVRCGSHEEVPRIIGINKYL